MTDIAADPLTLLSCRLSERLRATCREVLDPEVEAERITFDEAFQLMLTALTYELIAAARAIELSNVKIMSGVRECLADEKISETKH